MGLSCVRPSGADDGDGQAGADGGEEGGLGEYVKEASEDEAGRSTEGRDSFRAFTE
jgi:hypothetical protein